MSVTMLNVKDLEVQDSKRTIPFFTASDPIMDAKYDAETPSRKEIKHNLKNLEYICSGCGEEKRAGQLKACARCKTARYCSTECQRADWKVHKLDCLPPSQRGGDGNHPDVTLKLAARVGANEVLMDNILLHSVLQLELLRDVSNASKYVVRVTCGTLPADIYAYTNSLISGRGAPDNAQVLLNCKAIDRLLVEEAPALVQRFEKEKREKYVKSGGKDPLVIIYFVNEEGQMGVSMHARPIIPAMMYYMSTKPTMEIRSAMFGSQTVPLTEKAIIQQFNNQIYMDKSNKFKLRSYPDPTTTPREEDSTRADGEPTTADDQPNPESTPANGLSEATATDGKVVSAAEDADNKANPEA